ncbi:MAG: hypothetical protein CM15mP89_3980 [Gammaproteobacteria bacterium]|nr:MAG: hypothetical protein CM15mP89_3980 [Gammaproteobacteria bacterium]
MSATSAWQELCYTANKDQIDALEDWLFAAGAVSVTLEDDADQPLLEPGPGETPLWDAVRLTALFPGDMDLHRCSIDPPLPVLETPREPVRVMDQEWTRVWEEQFHPMKMGTRLWICPSWTPPPDPDAINILLDPGLAFGTGTHPTTAMCLRAIDAGLSEGQRVIDYGCGSGILGIAAARLAPRRFSPWITTLKPSRPAVTTPQEIRSMMRLSRRYCLMTPLYTAHWLLLIGSWPIFWQARSLSSHPSDITDGAGRQVTVSGSAVGSGRGGGGRLCAAVNLRVVDQVEDWVLLAGQRTGS